MLFFYGSQQFTAGLYRGSHFFAKNRGAIARYPPPAIGFEFQTRPRHIYLVTNLAQSFPRPLDEESLASLSFSREYVRGNSKNIFWRLTPCELPMEFQEVTVMHPPKDTETNHHINIRFTWTLDKELADKEAKQNPNLHHPLQPRVPKKNQRVNCTSLASLFLLTWNKHLWELYNV